ncbi:VOC family protein [Tessaracoccus palaemonis]|uniref:VOC domain-containing protein n=1 Tax=Tessaracoccus palaemonis TaxID=2829499 RepID=A0ABX8SP32_9ACTN|nr:VOC family protein [Tessaracoccus palaemonis]QXT62969.1 hypothetical protein KDB89_00285 [Tessaracoccus palaemonis]
MALLTVRCITINAVNPTALAAFWAELVGGVPADSCNGFILLEPGEGRVPLLFQQSEETDQRRGWIHLDCSVADLEAAIGRIEELGGRLVERRRDSSGAWVVMADPEGNPFCI